MSLLAAIKYLLQWPILAAIAFVWFFIFFLDTIFTSCMLYPYVRALSTFGVDIKLFSIFWRITRFNRYINRMGLYQAKFLKTWFQVGAVVTILIFIPCISMSVFKLVELVGTLNVDSPSNSSSVPSNSSSAVFDSESSKIVLVIPGYNFPLSYWKLYMCIMLVSSIIHEFGHALAASRFGIGVDSFGFAFILFVPVSFVNVRFDNMGHSTRWVRLYVYCAGIWHNIVLSLLCFFTLTYFSLLISPLYSVGGGVQVSYVNQLSPLNHHVTGLTPGERIYALSNCAVKDFNSWNACLQEIAEKQRGLCVPKNTLFNYTETVHPESCIESTDQLYFDVKLRKYQVGVCLHARTAVKSFKICTQHSECHRQTLCGFPRLPKSHRFIIIKRDEKRPVLYVGSVNELNIDVKVTEFIPKWKFISPSIPEAIKEFFQYTFIFSNGLACLNLLPIFALDGIFILENLVHILLRLYVPYEGRRLIIEAISSFTLLVFSSLIIVSLYHMSV